jgi:hypothetical protein
MATSIDYATTFASLGTTVFGALSSALPIVVPVFGGLVGLSIFIHVLGKFGISR